MHLCVGCEASGDCLINVYLEVDLAGCVWTLRWNNLERKQPSSRLQR